MNDDHSPQQANPVKKEPATLGRNENLHGRILLAEDGMDNQRLAATPIPDAAHAAEKSADRPPGLLEASALSERDRRALRQAFLDRLSARTDRIEEALDLRDRDRLADEVHSLKGTAPLFGLHTVAKLALSIEQRLRTGVDLNQIEISVTELVRICREAVATELRAPPIG